MPAVELTALLRGQRSISHNGHLPRITCLEGLAPPWQFCPVHAGTCLFLTERSMACQGQRLQRLHHRWCKACLGNTEGYSKLGDSTHNRQNNVLVSHLLQLTCLWARLAVSADACSALGSVS